MNFPQPKSKLSLRPTFSRERRFMQYTINARRTGVVIGPATYNFSQCVLQKTRKPCLVAYVILLEL